MVLGFCSCWSSVQCDKGFRIDINCGKQWILYMDVMYALTPEETTAVNWMEKLQAKVHLNLKNTGCPYILQ